MAEVSTADLTDQGDSSGEAGAESESDTPFPGRRSYAYEHTPASAVRRRAGDCPPYLV
ncbi:hypothetical protein SBV1_100026 [Verrucomicrobia bacterium]|nr:hypothetical protein SBV1_100026 [Verrucomicrobiota bacterium]